MDRKSDSLTIQPSNSSSCKAYTGQQIMTDNAHVVDANSNMQDYFWSSISRTADNKASQV